MRRTAISGVVAELFTRRITAERFSGG
jgi:hypothetical protein